MGYGNDGFFSHTNLYISNVTQQCRCSPIFRAWATCACMEPNWEAFWGLSIPLENSQQRPCLGPAVFVKLKI